MSLFLYNYTYAKILFKGYKIEALFAILGIYFFILIGFFAKKVFKNKIDEKTLTLLSVYFLQPILVFWGLTRIPLEINLLTLPLLYFAIVFIVLIILLILSKIIFQDSKEKSIYLAISLVGNTGHLGIPLGIALFGEESIPYTSILNVANIFFIYTFSVYFFAKEQFTPTQAIKSIFKIPIIWFAFIAVLYNYFGFSTGKQLNLILEMGSYTAIVLQLLIFGLYLSQIRLKTTPWKIVLNVAFAKHFILPLIALVVVLFLKIDFFLAAILCMQLILPLAVNNINNASIYNCRPFDVASAIFFSSFIFLVLIYFYSEILTYFFNEGL